MPTLTMIAGPNGSGKSSITASRNITNVIDPDAIAKALNPTDPSHAAIASGRQAILRARQCIAQLDSFTIETTLAGNGPLALFRDAKEAGFELKLIYVALTTPDLHMERVQLRFSRGGHDVPDTDIRRRYFRSMANAPVAIRMAGVAEVLDNSGDAPFRLFEFRNGALSWKHPGSIPAWAAEIEHALAT